MKGMLSAWQANHDVQLVLEAYSCIVYICDDMMKSHKGMSELLANTCQEAKDGNMTLKESVRHMGNKFLNGVDSRTGMLLGFTGTSNDAIISKSRVHQYMPTR